jgi:hypothetical protein
MRGNARGQALSWLGPSPEFPFRGHSVRGGA